MERRRIDIPDPSVSVVCRIPPSAVIANPLKQNRITKRNIGVALCVVGALVNTLVMAMGIILLVASNPRKVREMGKMLQISNQRKGGIIILGILLSILAWSPWITDQYAIVAVIDSLGGPDATYNYLGENITLQEISTSVVTVPFFKLVYFPGEAMYIVTFWGGVL